MIAKAVMQLMRIHCEIVLGSSVFGLEAETLMITAAITLGRAEGRLMTASDIANYIGLPRTTVIRKLNAAPLRHILKKRRRGNRIEFYIEVENIPGSKKAVRDGIAMIQNLAVELAGMDTK